MSKIKSAYIVIAHGSRQEESNESFFCFLERFKEACPNRRIEGAFLEIARPSIPQSIEKCINEGVKQVFIIPLMFFPGRHVKEDIPEYIRKAKEEHPEIDFHCAGPLAEHPMLVQLLKDKVINS